MYPRKKPACAFAIGANIRMATVLRFLANLLLFLSSSSPILRLKEQWGREVRTTTKNLARSPQAE